MDVGCLKFKLELSLVNLLVSRILFVWWFRWRWEVDSATDESPVVVDELVNDVDAEFSTHVLDRLDDVGNWYGRCADRFFIWWLLSDRRSNLLTASGDCVPEKIKSSS